MICLCDWISYLTLTYEYFTSSEAVCLTIFCIIIIACPIKTLLLTLLSPSCLLIHLSIWVTLLKNLYDLILIFMKHTMALSYFFYIIIAILYMTFLFLIHFLPIFPFQKFSVLTNLILNVFNIHSFNLISAYFD